ncbi:protoporphyrinogen oxidase [Nocardioides seonyuensis]|uniref:protoporphyrinogen oxidase n=1 Tax=Nocardioides seonyuensis TaxID=2518371 RepID=UPI001423A0D3|nr:protoporphyrinogen oxidase [Nocardioides seonyuensis]
MIVDTPHVAVVGAGIAGLSAAHRLHTLHPDWSVTIVEASDRIGGKLFTARHDGFVMEAGPDSMLGTHPAGAALLAALDLPLSPAAGSGRGTFVASRGRMHRLPDAMTGLLPRKPWSLAVSPLLSPWTKLRMAMEYAVPARAGDQDESVASFVTRRLGRGAYQRLADPMVGGIFAADPARLSLLSSLPHLRSAEQQHGGLIRALLADRRDRPSGARTTPAGPPLVAPAAGMDAIVTGLADRLDGVSLRLSSRLVGLDRDGQSWRLRLVTPDGGSTLAADAVVVAVPAGVASTALATVAPEAAAELARTEYTSTVTVSLGYRDDQVPARHRDRNFLTPSGEGMATRACTWSSTKFPGRAPAGHVLLRVSLGGPGRPATQGLTDDELVDIARRELLDTLGLDAAPVVTSVSRWEQLMPQYAVGHRERMDRVHRALTTHPGIALAGSAFHGVSVPDCIASGERAADAVATFLQPQGETA